MSGLTCHSDFDKNIRHAVCRSVLFGFVERIFKFFNDSGHGVRAKGQYSFDSGHIAFADTFQKIAQRCLRVLPESEVDGLASGRVGRNDLARHCNLRVTFAACDLLAGRTLGDNELAGTIRAVKRNVAVAQGDRNRGAAETGLRFFHWDRRLWRFRRLEGGHRGRRSGWSNLRLQGGGRRRRAERLRLRWRRCRRQFDVPFAGRTRNFLPEQIFGYAESLLAVRAIEFYRAHKRYRFPLRAAWARAQASRHRPAISSQLPCVMSSFLAIQVPPTAATVSSAR